VPADAAVVPADGPAVPADAAVVPATGPVMPAPAVPSSGPVLFPVTSAVPRRRRRRLRERPALMVLGLALGLAGIAFSALGITRQFLPRTFSAAQRQQIMRWEVAKRWRSWPAGQIFPAAVAYSLPGGAFGGGPGLSLVAHRVGIARQAGCHAGATNPATARVLTAHGCLSVLRATYTDQTQSLAVTVGVAVLPSARAAHESALPTSAMTRSGPLVHAVRFRRTGAAAFGDQAAQVPWERVAGPYLVLAAAGYADGRPWQATAGDHYPRSELASLARGVGRAVAFGLGARPPQPHCPGSPAC
jgi:hypothetical protein